MKNKDIDYFISFLEKFFTYNEKKKEKIINIVKRKDKQFGNWLYGVKDFNSDMQLGLLYELRRIEW